jgi:type I restriction enzyme M protein
MNQEIRRKLDRITNILFAGGVNNPITYIEQISYLIYLKLLDERESEITIQQKLGATRAKTLYPDQAKRYRWTEWRHQSGDKLVKFVRDEVFPYMSSINSDNQHIASYFRDAQLEIHDPAVLKQVVDEIDTISFSKLGSDVKGDIYEYMLTYLNTMEGALLGQFRTPRQIRKMMVELIDPEIGDTIFDPACGTGGFLIDALEFIMAKYSERTIDIPIYGEEWLLKKYFNRSDSRDQLKFKEDEFSFDNDPKLREKFLGEIKKEIPNLMIYKKGNGDKIPNWNILEASIYGVDVSRQIMRIATMNMVLHGLMKANIKRGNTLSQMGGLTEEDLYRQYKIILSNPPFAGVLPKESIRENLPKNTKKSELLFLAVMMDSLIEGGICAVVVPEGLLFGSSNAHLELRVRLVEQFQLLSIISLPAGVFKPYAGVKTSILVFRKPIKVRLFEDKPATEKVWFYEIKNDGYDADKITGGGRPETPDKNDIPLLIEQWNIYKKSGFKKPPGVEASSILEHGSEEPKCWWTSLDRIAENDYYLAPGRYKPQITQKISDEKPTELIKEVIEMENEIAQLLQKLLKKIAN